MRAVIIFALIAVVHCEFKISTGEDLDKYREECKAELGLSDELITAFKTWKFTDSHSACYINCVFRHMHLYDNDSGFSIDNLVTQLDQGRLDEIRPDIRPDIEKCIDNTITDNCQRAFSGFECFRKNNFPIIKASVN